MTPKTPMSAMPSLHSNSPNWLVSRPIAHRGLHRFSEGIIENSLSAAKAAIAKDFAIECDVQLSQDGEAIVFHDFALERLTGTCGKLNTFTASQLSSLVLQGSTDNIPTLETLLDVIGGRVTLICEIKSRFDQDFRLAKRVADIAKAYHGPLALKSFDPDIIAYLRTQEDLQTPLGIVAEAHYDDAAWTILSATQKQALSSLNHWPQTRPDFLSYHVNDLPHAATVLARSVLGIPVMSWTVRTPEQRKRAEQHADQIIFEGKGAPQN